MDVLQGAEPVQQLGLAAARAQFPTLTFRDDTQSVVVRGGVVIADADLTPDVVAARAIPLVTAAALTVASSYGADGLRMTVSAGANVGERLMATGARHYGDIRATAGDWLGSWTIFYWAWWISWSPFVGMFIARISRGRSIREFCLTVLFVPAGVSIVWFAIFGGTAITLERAGDSIWGDGSAENQLFALLHTMPGGTIAGFVAMVLLGTFFITSADSASTVMGSMSQRGRATASRSSRPGRAACAAR